MCFRIDLCMHMYEGVCRCMCMKFCVRQYSCLHALPKYMYVFMHVYVCEHVGELVMCAYVYCTMYFLISFQQTNFVQ